MIASDASVELSGNLDARKPEKDEKKFVCRASSVVCRPIKLPSGKRKLTKDNGQQMNPHQKTSQISRIRVKIRAVF